MEESLCYETWEIHNRINLYLLDSIAPEALKGIASSKGRNVAEQFAHIHNVRLMWVNQAGGSKDLNRTGRLSWAILSRTNPIIGDRLFYRLRRRVIPWTKKFSSAYGNGALDKNFRE